MTDAGGANMLEVTGLTKRFRGRGQAFQAVAGVDLAIAAGGALGLVGESGCGKTTLARAVLRLVEPDAGRVLLDGRPVTGLPPAALRRRRPEMQIVFQDPSASMDPRRTVGDSIVEPLAAAGRPARERRTRLQELLDEVGLPADSARRYPHELSGGQRQRAAIARAIATRPRLLVADEPVSALDVSVQAQVLELLARLRASQGLTLLFISHDLAVVRQVADRVAVMRGGRIVEEGAVEAILAAPRHRYTRSLLEAVPDPFD